MMRQLREAIAVTTTYAAGSPNEIESTFSFDVDEMNVIRLHDECGVLDDGYCCDDDTPCYCDTCNVQRYVRRMRETLAIVRNDDDDEWFPL
jgi:hypothetical protein